MAQVLAPLPGSAAHAANVLTARAQVQRIASFNICIDQLLWAMVPHQQLVSMSYLSANPLWSPIAAELQGISLNHGLAEEVVPLHPDLVLAGEFDASNAMDLLQRLQLNVERLPVPRQLADIDVQIRQLAQLVGAQARGEQLIADIDAQIRLLRNAVHYSSAPRAFWYSSNGVVIGADTLENELMHMAGLRNLAAEQGIVGFSPLDLELLLSARPQILIIEESNSGAYSLAREYLANPALAQAGVQIIRLPAGLSGCAASVVAEVAQSLRTQLRELPSN